MPKLNHHYQKLKGDYLFPEIDRRVSLLKSLFPSVALINLGIGDVTQPLPAIAVKALQDAALEMGQQNTLKGYGPAQGYPFLREAIAEQDYKGLGIAPDEIFISDGAKSDIANLQEIFAVDNRVALSDPTYPVYIDTNVMAGRTRLPLKTGRFGGVTYLACTAENHFSPEPPNSHADIIYLCSPNNPTGMAMSKSLLEKWVAYAKKEQAVIIFDGAYEAYITSDKPRSIFEIEGAKDVAIEVRSYSKSAGFTGLRCSYTVIPHQLIIQDAGKTHSLHALWKRRCSTKSNGVSFPVQKAAAALYTSEGQLAVREIVQTYARRARFLKQELEKMGYVVYGGIDAPYLWCKTPPKVSSWDFFDLLLERAHLITVPGQGFGPAGEGYFRLSAFADQSQLEEALKRLQKL